MRLIKGFILALAGLFIVVTLVSLLMPSSVVTVRAVTIHAKAEQVFSEIADLKNWKHWHPLFIKDSSAIRLSEPSSGNNAYAEWNSSDKKNKLQITAVQQEHVELSLMRTSENDVNNMISVTSLNDSNNIQVEWRVLTKLKWYPWEKFSGIFIDKMTGPGYEAALNNLRKLIEPKPY